MLIRQFDGFRRLCLRAALNYQHRLTLADEDMLLANRVLAALGGPPAPAEVRGEFRGDGLDVLLLYLLTQGLPCRVGIIGESERVMGRLKSVIHLFSHAVYPMVTGKGPLPFHETVNELDSTGAVVRPLVIYDADGEPVAIEPEGAAGSVGVGADQGPYTLAIPIGAAGLAPLADGSSGLHPTVLILSRP